MQGSYHQNYGPIFFIVNAVPDISNHRNMNLGLPFISAVKWNYILDSRTNQHTNNMRVAKIRGLNIARNGRALTISTRRGSSCLWVACFLLAVPTAVLLHPFNLFGADGQTESHPTAVLELELCMPALSQEPPKLVAGATPNTGGCPET